MTGENLECDEAEEKGSEYQVGDNVVVKPVNKRCTSRWAEGVVTGIVSRSNVCLLYTSPSPRDKRQSRMPSSA